MRKKIFIIIIILIIIVGIIFAQNANKSKFEYEILEVTEYNYYVYKENDLYGVIDKAGNTVIKATYSSIIIPNPDKDIFVCYNEEEIEILNSQNEKLFTEYEKVQPIKLKNVASTLAYEKNVLMYQEDGKYGLIDFDGNIIIKNIYDSIENLQPTEGKFIVSKDGKYGVVDINGNVVVDVEYDKIQSDGYYTESDGYKKSGFIVLNIEEDGYKYGYVGYTGKTILETQYNDIERISEEDDKNIYLIVSENGQYGVYNNSKKIIENEYQSISYSEDVGLLILQKNKKYGVASLDGTIVIEVENDSIDAKGIYLYASKSNDNTVYDVNGNVVDINYNRSIYKTYNEEYMISTILNNDITYYGITDKNTNQLVEEKYRYIEYLYKDYFIATDEQGNLGVINSKDENITEMKYSSLQKIKNKNIVQATDSNTGITEFYSLTMENTLTVSKPTIENKDEYVTVSSDNETYYLDENGNLIEDTDKIETIGFPNQIGEYTKYQVTIDTIYYVKE